MSSVRFERVGKHDFYQVYIGTEEIGTVLGDGPTRDTRWKAISPNNCYMDPDQAPALGYGRTKEEAAAVLAR